MLPLLSLEPLYRLRVTLNNIKCVFNKSLSDTVVLLSLHSHSQCWMSYVQAHCV